MRCGLVVKVLWPLVIIIIIIIIIITWNYCWWCCRRLVPVASCWLYTVTGQCWPGVRGPGYGSHSRPYHLLCRYGCRFLLRDAYVHSALYAMVRSGVNPSVRPSHGRILSKWLNYQRRLVTQGFGFIMQNILVKFGQDDLNRNAENTTIRKNWRFSWLFCCISEMIRDMDAVTVECK